MEIIKSKTIAKPVILIKILNNSALTIIDAETTVRFFNKSNLELKSGFKVGVKHKHYKSPVVAFSNNGNYFALLSFNAKESRLYNAKTKKIIAKIDRHHGEASCVAIDPFSRYMFSCGDDGKTFAIDIESGKLLFTLPSHADTINDIAFSSNGNWVATASYDRKISLFSLVTMTPKNKLKAHSAPIMHLRFFQKNKLLSIDKKSTAIVWNIYNGKILGRLQGIHDEVTAMVIDNEENFLFLGTQLGYILVYDLEKYELVSAKYIKITSPITSLEFDKDYEYLIVGTEDGFIIYYDIFEGAEALKDLLQKKDFKAVQKLIESNPLLVYTQIYSLISNFWEKSLEKAKLALQKGDKEKAMLIFGNFKDMPSKNRIIQKTIRDYSDFPKFVQFIKEGKLSLAYGLASRFPLYRESTAYRALEERWKKVFAQAQKYALNPKTVPLAKEILSPYRGVSEKTKFIQDVLTKAEIYKRFRSAFSKKEFKICFELTKKYSFLKELPEYENLMKYADNLYIKAQEAMKKGELHAAIKILRILEDFEEFKNEAHNFVIDLESKAKFFNAIEENDLETAYNMMALAEDLMQTEDGLKLQQIWNDDLQKANAFAALGDIKNIKKTVQKYIKINSKYRALGTVFSFAYIVQLENALQREEKREKIENGIKNYMVNFGLSEQIEAFFNLFKDKYPETKLNLELLKKGSFSMWRPSMIVDSILE